MPKPPLLHIGYHKTASTWLQEELFASEPFELVLSKEQIKDSLVLPGPFEETYLTYQDSDKVPVISSERLSGSPFSGGYDTRLIADRLKQNFPDAKVLIVIRDQVEMIHSCYLQHIRVGGSFSLNDFLQAPKRFRGVVPNFDLNYFRYIELVKYYIERFGEDNVLVLDYELFKTQPQDFCQKICNLYQVSTPAKLNYNKISNPKIGLWGVNIAMQLNKLCSRSVFNPHALDLDNLRKGYRLVLSWLDALTPKALQQAWYANNKQIIQNLIKDRYTKSNLELKELNVYSKSSLTPNQMMRSLQSANKQGATQ